MRRSGVRSSENPMAWSLSAARASVWTNRPWRSNTSTPLGAILVSRPSPISSKRCRNASSRPASRSSMRPAAATASASAWRLNAPHSPETSNTATTSPSAGSRTTVAAQVQGLMPAQKCSAAWTCTGPPTARAVPMALVPQAGSCQLAPVCRRMRRAASTVAGSPSVCRITPRGSVRIMIVPDSDRISRACAMIGTLASRRSR